MNLKIDLEMNFAECVIDIGKATLGTEQRLRMSPLLRKQNEAILQAVCALLNSGGGMIKAEIENEEYHYESHGVGLDLPPLFRSYLDERQRGNLFLIFVKLNIGVSGLRLATLCSNLYRMLGTSTEVMDSQEALAFLRGKTQAPVNNSDHNSLSLQEAGVGVQDEGDMRNLANALFNRPQLWYLEKLNSTESMHVEFQMFTTDLLQHIKETLPKYVSTFANTEGGYVFFGVHDETHQVIGCEKEKIDLATLWESIDGCIKKVPVHHFCTQSHKIQHDIKFLEVLDEGIPRGFVLAVTVDLCCAACAQVPSSWQVRDSSVRQLATKKWAAWMVEADPDLSRFPQVVLELSLSSGTPRSKTICTHKIKCLEEQQKSYFPVLSDRILYTPESIYKELFSQHRELRELKNMKMHSVSQGVLIFFFSRSWAMDLGPPENQGVICDALLISQNNTCILYCIFSQWDTGCKGYSMMVACSLKERLVNTGGYTERLCIIPLVCVLNLDRTQNTPFSSEVQIYPEPYYLTTMQHMEALLKSLVIVLRGFRSLLSDELGSDLSLLTDQQYKLFSKNLRKTRELFVHGLPGSGKSMVALKIMEKSKNVFHKTKQNNMFHCEQKTLYICENQPLKKLVRKNICLAVTFMKTFMKSNFEEIQHIIVDAQNFCTEDGDWYGRAKRITQKDKNCPGIPWIFLDYFGINYMSCSGLPPLSAQHPKEELPIVVRKADKIAQYLQGVMQEVRENPPPNIPGSLVMLHEAKWAQGVPGNVECHEYLDAKMMMYFVIDRFQVLCRSGFSPKDIAVLFVKANEIEKYKTMFVQEIRKRTLSQVDEASVSLVQITDASDIQANHIAVDSLCRFLGLERNTVFGIIPWEFPAVSHDLQFCLASKARKRLYILKVSI
ncbi:LOW QUALITY PROTEIN: schlafen family member 5 [Erethizon dorsatum]